MRSRGRGSLGYPRALTALAVALAATFTALRLFFNTQLQVVPPLDSPAAQVEAGHEDDLSFETPENEDPAPQAITISTTLERTAPLESYLVEAGMDRGEAHTWAMLFRRVSTTRYLEKGQPLTIYKDPETGETRGIKYDIDTRTAVTEAHLGNGVLKANVEAIQYLERPVRLTFAVTDNFRRAAAENGIPQPIIETLEDAFSAEHDLNRLAPGSSVKLIYQEKVSRDGNYTMPSDVEAAQIRFGTRTLNAFSFRDEHGRPHLYDESGRPLGPQELRFPLNFKYISSGFTFHRYHPLLHIYRPHVGVDLAADYGTPVKAVADGKVEAAGWQGELGNCVRLSHQNGMVSIYGQMEKISPDVKTNGYVRVGQVIGFVGSTGLSTGPHLHFALEKAGAYVNPLTEKLGENHQVSPRMQGLFNDIKERYELALAKLPDLGSHFVAPGDRKPAISQLADMYHVTIHRAAAISRHRSRRAHGAIFRATESTSDGAL
jgi:murein DD-endopeptidase MepM/ murein hydrolase activator NlpD